MNAALPINFCYLRLSLNCDVRALLVQIIWIRGISVRPKENPIACLDKLGLVTLTLWVGRPDNGH